MTRSTAALVVALTLVACQSGPGSRSEAAQDIIELDAIAPTEPARPPVPRAGPLIRPAAQTAPPNARERRLLVRTGAVRLRAEDHGRAVARTRALAGALGGFVGGEQSHRYADRVETTLTVRVPANRFDTLLAAVSALDGEVESRTVAVDDVTRQTADVEARLTAKRAAEAQLLEILERAGSVDDVLAIQSRLGAVREDIESTEAQLPALRDQVALSTLAVTLFEASAAGITAGPGFGARAGYAVADGWDALLGFILGLLTVWPFLLIGTGLAWLVRRRGLPRWRRRPDPPGQ